MPPPSPAFAEKSRRTGRPWQGARRIWPNAGRRLGAAPDDPAALALEAWALHGWYSALESILERVARQLDAEVPSGERWRRELLTQASVEVPGVRPALLPTTLRADLEELLSMRHFLRHAYGAELDPARLRLQAERLARVAPSVERALDTFDAFLVAASGLPKS